MITFLWGTPVYYRTSDSSDGPVTPRSRDIRGMDGKSTLAAGRASDRSGEVEAMADLNKVFLMGRLTFDPELRRTPERDRGDRASSGHDAVRGRAATASAARKRCSSV